MYTVVCIRDVTKSLIIVSNRGNNCIKVLVMSCHLVQTYDKEGKAGQGDGELYHPWGVCTDPVGRLILTAMTLLLRRIIARRVWYELCTHRTVCIRPVCY